MQKMITNLKWPDELLGVTRASFPGGSITPESIDYMLQLVQALWLHDGDPSRPHAELHSGKCSTGFVNAGKLLVYPNIAHLLADEMIKYMPPTPKR